MAAKYTAPWEKLRPGLWEFFGASMPVYMVPGVSAGGGNSGLRNRKLCYAVAAFEIELLDLPQALLVRSCRTLDNSFSVKKINIRKRNKWNKEL
jgi:hypothetical protein